MKVLQIVIPAVLVVGIVGGGLFYKKSVDAKFADYETQLDAANAQINDLSSQMNYTGELVNAYQLKDDVKGGTLISEDQLEEVMLPKAYANNCPQSIDEIDKKYYLFDMQKGQTLTYNLMMDFGIDDNMRELDVVLDQIPIGLEVGDYIDVNISFTLGQNFTGLTHKRVLAINESVVKLVVDPKDIYVYESMKVDRAIYEGTTVYGIKYVEGGAQLAGKDYYPARLETLRTMLQDPNVTMDYSSLSTVDRDLLEQQLNNSTDATKDLLKTVSNAKEKLNDNYTSAKNIYDRAVEDALAEAKARAEREAEEAAYADSSSDDSSSEE